VGLTCTLYNYTEKSGSHHSCSVNWVLSSYIHVVLVAAYNVVLLGQLVLIELGIPCTYLPCTSAQTMHVHHICRCRWGACGTCYVCCRRSCLVFVVSKLQWPRRIAININLSQMYLNGSDCVTHICPIPLLWNRIPHDIPSWVDPPRTYVQTYIHVCTLWE